MPAKKRKRTGQPVRPASGAIFPGGAPPARVFLFL